MQGGAMENQEYEGAAVALGHRTIMPRAYVADAEADMRTFLAENLQELGFIVGECA